MKRTNDDLSAVLGEQRTYYEARAPEYDDWWQRRGRYDCGAEANARWFAEVDEVHRWLVEAIGEVDSVLEIAGGTGNFTVQLARLAKRVTVLDAAPATVAIARQRLERAGLAERVEHRVVDVFEWQPIEGKRYDAVSFSFWLSHVPAARRAEFLGKVARAVAPGGVVAIVDSARPSRSAPPGDVQRGELQLRQLDDGRQFEIVKRYDTPAELEAELAAHGLVARAARTERYFVYCKATAPPLQT